MEKEEFDWLLLMQAAIKNDPSMYGPMSDEIKARYNRMRKEIEEAKKKNPNVTFDIPYGY